VLRMLPRLCIIREATGVKQFHHEPLSEHQLYTSAISKNCTKID
jgi:hypothetical protein